MNKDKDLLDDVIRELDLKDLDEEFKEEELEEEEIEEEDVEIDEDETDREDDVFIDVDNHDFLEKPTKEQKSNYAFAELRRANKEKEEELKRLSNIAEAYGFKNYEEMVKQLENEAVDKKAKEENLDPKIYRRIHDTEKKLETLEREREEERLNHKVRSVNDKIDNFISNNNLDEKHKDELLIALDNDGFTIDDLYKISNPNRLFKGYVSEAVNESRRQRSLEKEKKRKTLEEDRYRSPGAKSNYSIEDLIDSVVNKKQDKY